MQLAVDGFLEKDLRGHRVMAAGVAVSSGAPGRAAQAFGRSYGGERFFDQDDRQARGLFEFGGEAPHPFRRLRRLTSPLHLSG